MATKIQNRRGTATEWSNANPTLSAGEIGFEIDTNKVKIGDGSTTWNNLQYLTGSGGGSGKNYIARSDFESNSTTGWLLRHSDVDASRVPFQSAASWSAADPSLALSTVSTGQLSGKYSLALSSVGSTFQGDMLVSEDIVLDLEAQASVLTWSFFYKVVSAVTGENFSGTPNNAVGVAVYVVDGALAGQWIQPAGAFNLVQRTGVGKASGTFQVPSDATKVRLAVYFPNDSSGSLTVYFDDFYLGPQAVQYGAPVTNPVSAVPSWSNIGFSGTSRNSIVWWRVGKFLFAKAYFNPSTGTGSASALSLTLPSGLSIDAASLPGPEAPASLGFYKLYDDAGGAATGIGTVDYESQTAVSFRRSDSGTFATSAMTTADTFSCEFSVPILGWDASVQMSNDTDTRVVSFNGQTTGGQVLTAAVTDIAFSINQDTHGAWDGSKFIAPVSGFYQVNCSMRFTVATSRGLLLCVDGSSVAHLTVSTLAYAAGSASWYLRAGQSLSVRSTASSTVNSGLGYENTISIFRLSGPSAIAASESVNARATTTGNSIPNNALTIVNFGTKVFDSHGAVATGAAWKFTAPTSGKYRVSGGVQFADTAATYTAELFVYKNGAPDSVLGQGTKLSASAAAVFLGGSTVLSLQAGDSIDIRVQQNTGAALALRTTTAFGVSVAPNSVSIERIGN